MTLPDIAVQSIRRTIGLLVDHEYQALETMTEGHRLRAQEMEHAIRTYGRTLVDPDEERFSDMRIFDMSERDQHAFSVEIPLQTQEEGRSDLELHLTLREIMENIYSVEIDNILVP